MIPKIIHYCWLSSDPLPDKIKDCMHTWQNILPEYEIKLWDMKAFDVNSVPYVREACEHRKWAFAADYIRMYALYTEGGIYLDSDVKILKPFDGLLDSSFMSSMEYHQFQIDQEESYKKIDSHGNRIVDSYVGGIQIQAAIMGAEKGCQYIKDVLDWYQERHFVKDDGTLATDVIAPQIYARVAERYGFKYQDVEQRLPGRIVIYPSEVFAGNEREATKESYAIHYCENSWVSEGYLNKLKKYWCFFWFLCKQKLYSCMHE